jgi:hypothetical protein
MPTAAVEAAVRSEHGGILLTSNRGDGKTNYPLRGSKLTGYNIFKTAVFFVFLSSILWAVAPLARAHMWSVYPGQKM